MGLGLLCCVVLCLLGADPVESGVTQTPTYSIKARKQQVTVRCSFISGHYSVYWYQQAQGQGLQFLIEYYDGQERAKGNFPGRFSVRPTGAHTSELTMSLLELTDSAVYFCASSVDTALHARQPAVQKHKTLLSQLRK